MSRTREDLEAEVTRCEGALAEAQRELAAFDARPEGCQCDPREWGDVPGPICTKFEPDTDPQFSDLCRHCQHPAECHADRERMRKHERGGLELLDKLIQAETKRDCALDRAEAAESQLAAAREENERIRFRLETIANEHGGPVPVLTVEAAIDHVEAQLNAQLVALRDNRAAELLAKADMVSP